MVQQSTPSAGRRHFLQTIAAVTTGSALAANKTLASMTDRPRLGVVTHVVGPGGPEPAIAKVHELGFRTCQVSVGMSPSGLAAPLREALEKYHVEATAVMTLGEGKMVW